MAILGLRALSLWGLWQPGTGANWAFFSPRCGIRGYGRAITAITPYSLTPGGPGLPQPPIRQRRGGGAVHHAFYGEREEPALAGVFLDAPSAGGLSDIILRTPNLLTKNRYFY